MDRALRDGIRVEELALQLAHATCRERWSLVHKAEPPAWSNPNPLHPYPVSVRDEPSAAFVERGRLHAILCWLVTKALRQGRWELTGKFPGRGRATIDPPDRGRMDFDFGKNSVGQWVSLRAVPVDDHISIEGCMALIKRICDLHNPGEALTKPVVESFVHIHFGSQFSINVFKEAWNRADIDKGWRKRGPRSNLDSN